MGIALFVQGCPFKCYNCFNPDTWDFSSGKEWTEDVENNFIELAKRPYIKRVTILGGEPLADENLSDVLNLVNKIRILFGNTKTIWLYTGYTYEECMQNSIRKEVVSNCDILVDGRYVDDLRDISLPYRGSSNQRIIDIQKSTEDKVVLYEI